MSLPLLRPSSISTDECSCLLSSMTQPTHVPACVQGYQVDWEAILSRSSEPFVASVSAWLYPPAARGEPAAQAPHQAPAPELAQLPAVKQVLGSARARLEALNAPLPAKGQS